MASIVREKNRKRIDFVHPDGKRRSIRLGVVSMKDAGVVRTHIERLVASKITGGAVADETSRWLVQLDKVLADRLARAGLVDRVEDEQAVGLLQHVDQYVSRRTDAKPSTVTVWKRTRNHLKRHFGDVELRAVTIGDAKDFRRDLLKRGLAEATVRRTCGIARQFFADAVDRQLIARNPFRSRDLPTATSGNASRFYFVDRDLADKVLAALPDAQWKLMFALARYGGLRCPSEVLSLRWSDIDWENGRIVVTSPKTEHHAGGGSRTIPLFPELVPYLNDAWELADDGAEHVITRYRKMDSNYGVLLMKLVKRAKLPTWPKPFQNLRSTRETELAETFPIHVVCDWIGNSEAVARRHYLQIHGEHFARATAEPQQIPQQSQAVTGEHTMPVPSTAKAKTPEIQDWTLNLRGLPGVPGWALQDLNL